MLPPPFIPQVMSPNADGQDWLVGDIHGRFDRLAIRLRQVSFDPAVDRLFSVGDLVDRDRRSALALEWLQQPWFHAILGNHEQLYLKWRELKADRDAQFHYERKQYFDPRNGGAWVADQPESFHAQLEPLIRALPTVRVLSARDGRTALLVHAQLPVGMRWPRLLGEAWPDVQRDELTWGRSRWQAQRNGQVVADDHQIPGLDAVIVGHTTVREPSVLGSMLYLDTGGWQSPARTVLAVMTLTEALDRVAAGTTVGPADPVKVPAG